MPEIREREIPITITGWPGSAGLRIRFSSMMAFYISSADPEAAKYWCEIAAVQMAVIRRLIDLQPDESAMLDRQPLDWNAIIMKGSGSLLVKAQSAADTDKAKQVGNRIFKHPYDLQVDRWKSPNGPFFMITDKGDLMDAWILESIKSDLEK
jgi:hypothetical protein